MNLYDLHSNPKSLYGYEKADKEVPELIWDRYEIEPAELKKREKAIAKNPKYAYYYALYVLKDRFPAGEKAIANAPEYAHPYARNVLRDRFPAGEKAIASDPRYAYPYAYSVLRDRFPAGEKAIASDPDYADLYTRRFNLHFDEENKRFVEK